MALLEACGLVKYYGKRCVVQGVNFEVNAGEVVGLLGPNGAGKTTSFRMTTGQLPPYAGKVIFNGQDVTGLPQYLRARLGMGYLSQETSVFRKLSVEQNILAILEIIPKMRTLGRKLTRTERWERTDKVLHQFGLTHVRKNAAGRLSGGEKRRLEIARCLVCEPLLILLDEPFTGIDPKTIADIQQIVLALRDSGISMLLTDHNVREALKITTRSYLIKDGKVRTHGTPIQIINDPIAINEYLGTGFNDNTFGAPPPPASPPVRLAIPRAEEAPPPEPTPATAARPAPRTRDTEPSGGDVFLEQEKVLRLIEGLKSSEAETSTWALIKRGSAAVPTLLSALERRDVEIRRQAQHVLQKILQRTLVFDPYAPEATRRQQLAAIRDHLERKAG